MNRVEVIYSVPLYKLTNINSDIDEAFLSQVIKALPQIGQEHPNYYLINNNFTLDNPNNLEHIHIYNTFVIQSQRKGQVLQLTKNNEQS